MSKGYKLLFFVRLSPCFRTKIYRLGIDKHDDRFGCFKSHIVLRYFVSPYCRGGQRFWWPKVKQTTNKQRRA